MLLRLVAGLPHARVGAVPVVHQPVDQPRQVAPRVVADAGPVLVEQVDRVDQVAVDVELQLARGGVPDADRARPGVAGQVVELDLLVGHAAVEVVEDAQRAEPVRARVVLLAEPLGQPADERAGLVEEAEPQQRVQAEAGVAHPHVAVVPVAGAADLLGQAGRHRGHDPAGRLVAEHLQRQGRPFHGLPPPPPVRGLRDPALPEGVRRVEERVHAGRGRRDELLVGVEDLQLEEDPVAAGEVQVGHDVVAVDAHVGRRAEAEPDRGALDEHAAVDRVQGGPFAAVVGPGGEPHLQPQVAAHALDATHDALPVLVVVRLHHGHEVVHLDHALVGEEAGVEDVGRGQVRLVGTDAAVDGREVPRTALLGVEDAGEDARGVEAAGAEPVDAAVGGDERGGPQVADHPVLGDRGWGRRPPGRSPPTACQAMVARPVRSTTGSDRPARTHRPGRSGPRRGFSPRWCGR